MIPTWTNQCVRHLSRFFLVYLVLFWIIFGVLGGGRPFSTPDEARYVEIPREMVESGDYITPRLNGVKYFEKPPLFYWMQAGMIALFGIQEHALRFPGWLLGLLGVISLYYFLIPLRGKDTAQKAAVILSTTVLYHGMSLFITLDMPVSIWMDLALLCFYGGLFNQSKRRLFWLGFSIGCAFGVLTKGLVALALPGLVIVLFLLIGGYWSYLRPLYLIQNGLIFLTLVLPWHGLVSHYNPDFCHKYFYVEHFLRYTTPYHSRSQPIWFFSAVLLVGFLPWSLACIEQFGAIRNNFSRKNPFTLYLIIWSITFFVFFSWSNSKLIPYILPIWMPLSALLAIHYPKDFNSKRIIILLLVLLAACGSGIMYQWSVSDLNPITGPLAILSGILIVMIGFALKIRHSFLFYGIFACVLIQFIHTYFPKTRKPSIKPISEFIMQHTHSNHPVACLGYLQDLPVYLDKKILCVGYLGELEFGKMAEDTQSWMMSEAEFVTHLTRHNSIWVVSKKTDFTAFSKQYPGILSIFYDNGYYTIAVPAQGPTS